MNTARITGFLLLVASTAVFSQVGTMPIPDTDTAVLETSVDIVPGIPGGTPTEYIYRYTVTNPASSADPIYKFSVDISSEERDFRRPVLQTVPKQGGATTLPLQNEIDHFSPFYGIRGKNVVQVGLECPAGWTGGLRGDGTIVCYAANGTPLINPGESLSGFAIHSRFPPTLRDIHSEAFWTVVVDSLEQDEDTIDPEAAFDVLENLKQTQRDLAPASFFPTQREHYSTFEADLAEMIALGWVPDSALASELTTIVDDAGELFRTGQGVNAKLRLDDVATALSGATSSEILQNAATHLSVSVDSIQEFGRNSFPSGGLDTQFRPVPEIDSLIIGETFELSIFVFRLNVFDYEEGVVEEPIPDRSVFIGCDDSAPVPAGGTECPNFPNTGFGNRVEVFTDSNGIATFTYTGTEVGRDILEVCGDSSCEGDFGPIVVDWRSEVDLVIEAFSPPLLLAESGDTITFTDLTTNFGSGPSGESITAYYLSDLEVVDPQTAIFVGDRDVPALAAGEVSEAFDIQFDLPAGLPEGFYNLIACADDEEEIVESDELNNCSNIQLEGSEFLAIPVADFEDLFVVTVNDVSVAEGDSGVTNAIVEFELSQPNPDADISFDFSIVDGSATLADNDYVGTDGNITFAAGSGGPETRQVSVSIIGDSNIEDNETVAVIITPLSGDALYRSQFATITIVDDDTNANTAPVANDQAVSTLENVPTNVTLTAQDDDDDNLSFSVQTGPGNGVLSGTAPILAYTPNPNFSGADSFTFVANDGTIDSNIATVSISVILVNVAPVADDQSVVTDEDVAVPVTLTAQDGDGDSLSFAVQSGPTNGSLSGTAPNFMYTPNAGFSGNDSFTFIANDGLVDSNIATVSIAINAVNVAPVADAGSDQTVGTGETVVFDGSSSSDADGDSLTFSWTLVSVPGGSTAVLTDASAVNPSIVADLSGTYVAQLIVNDGTVDSAPDTVTILAESSTFVLVIDEESIKKDEPPNYFSEGDVNGDIAELGLRTQLPVFAANVGQILTLYTGEVGDEGWFALPSVPSSWAGAGPTTDGLRNYVGELQPSGEIEVGDGLGLGNDPEELLDKVPGVTPLRATGLTLLVGQQVCAVVQDSDVSINYDPIDGSLKGKSLGRVAFRVLSVTPMTGQSSSSLPEVEIEVLNADQICEGDLFFFEDVPEPISSSEPFDTGQNN